MNSSRIFILTALSTTALLAGCSSPTIGPTGSDTTVSFEHIHELVVGEDPDDLLVSTHQGLYRLTIDATGSAVAVGPIGGLDFDPMGFTVVDGIAYASGHPGPTTPGTFGTPNLGLIASSDLGETWNNISLTGHTDFHSLTAAANQDEPVSIFGLSPDHPHIQRSLDAGLTWSSGAELTARDILAIDGQVYASTPDGLAISSDKGTTFTVDPTAPMLYILAADEHGAIAGVDTTGTLWTHSAQQGWVHGHTVEGIPQALALEGTRIYVADDRGITFTEDLGATWTALKVYK